MSSRCWLQAVVGGICVGTLVACAGDGDSGGGSIDRSLQLVAAEVYDIAEDEADGRGVLLTVGDLVAVSEAIGLDAPGPDRDPDDVSKWFVEMSVGREQDETEVVIALPPEYSRAFVQAESFDDVLGLDIGAAETFADLSVPPVGFIAFGGDLEFDRSLDIDEGADGSLGDGDDGELALEPSPVNPIGRVLRLGQRADAVAITASTPVIGAWTDDDETLADDERFSELARVLDDAGAVAAVFLEADFGDVGPFASQELIDRFADAALIDERFEIVGAGVALVGDEPGNVIAYLFDDEDEASGAVRGVEEAWTDVELLSRPGTDIDDLFDVVEVRQDGPLVVVTVTPADGGDTKRVASLLFSQDIQFFHS